MKPDELDELEFSLMRNLFEWDGLPMDLQKTGGRLHAKLTALVQLIIDQGLADTDLLGDDAAPSTARRFRPYGQSIQ